MHSFAFIVNFFSICRLCHAHVRKDTRLSPISRTASDENLGGALGNGARLMTDVFFAERFCDQKSVSK